MAVAADETNRVSMIRGAGNEDTSLTEGTVTYDIRFFAIAPVSGELIRLIINIEAQNDFYPGYPLIKRGIYYCCWMISAQYGTEFTNSHYVNIKKVYSIWICMNPPKSRENSITRYYIAEENLVGSVKEQKADYDLMAAVMICLGKEGDSGTDLLKLLNVILSTGTGSQDNLTERIKCVFDMFHELFRTSHFLSPPFFQVGGCYNKNPYRIYPHRLLGNMSC